MREKGEIDLDIIKLLKDLWRHIPIILIVALAASALAAALFYSPVSSAYTAESVYLVDISRFSSEKQINSPESTIATYCYAATTRANLEKVISRSGLPYSAEALSSKVSAVQEDKNAFVFAVKVSGHNKSEALQIAEAYAEILPAELGSLMPNAALRVLDPGSVREYSTGGFPVKKVILAALIAVLLMILWYSAVNIAKSANGKITLDLSDLRTGYPQLRVLNAFPSDLSDREAARKLRTVVRILCPEGGSCKVVGLTSAHRDNGKEAVALSLAASLAELGSRVLLVDADLSGRRLQTALGAENKSGFSELLLAHTAPGDQIRRCEYENRVFSFLPAGGFDRSSLLNGKSLSPALEKLKGNYDYIILDLCEIGSTLDAVEVGRQIDGLILFLRENTCTRNQLDTSLSLLELAKVKLLGAVVAAPCRRIFRNPEKSASLPVNWGPTAESL